MSLRFAVVHEAEADLRIATELADRVLLESVDWLDSDLLGYQREWLHEVPDGQRITWTRIKLMARAAGVRSHGHFEGEPALPDAAAARRALYYLLEMVPELDAVVFMRDRDAEPERRDGLEQARNQDKTNRAIVVGLAVVEREAWVLSGFEPSEDEVERHEAERKNLGFDPRTHSHELTACKNDAAKRSPKRVLRALCGDHPDRERTCWTDTPLDALRQRGADNGLADYLGEVRDRLAPRIGRVANSEGSVPSSPPRFPPPTYQILAAIRTLSSLCGCNCAPRRGAASADTTARPSHPRAQTGSQW